MADNSPDSVEITFEASKKWRNTGISVKAGETYSFQAAGTGLSDASIPSGPDGYSISKDEVPGAFSRAFLRFSEKMNFKRINDARFFALVVTIGKSCKRYYIIGSSREVTFTQDDLAGKESAELYCFLNDVSGFYWNNKGRVILTVSKKSP